MWVEEIVSEQVFSFGMVLAAACPSLVILVCKPSRNVNYRGRWF